MALPRRLDKFVREATALSLGRVRELLDEGKIQCSRLGPRGNHLDPSALVYSDDEIFFCGERLFRRSDHHTYLLNKPKNVTSTARDPDGKRDVSEWLVKMAPGTFPVGRLDRETTGALLFTTDGDLATAVLRPDHRTQKTYWLWLNESISRADVRLEAFTRGMPMRDGLRKADEVSVLSSDENMTELLVTLTEGKNRQIRRMCRALDLRLLHLHRRSVGPIELGTLPLGELRALSATEVASLWSSLGGRQSVQCRQIEALYRLAHSERAAGLPNLLLEQWLSESAGVQNEKRS